MKNFNFGENLRMIRNYKNTCQEGIAAGLKISQASYSRIEASRDVPETWLIHKLAGTLDVRPKDLLSTNWYSKAVNHDSGKSSRSVILISKNGKMAYAFLLAIAVLDAIFGAVDGAKIESLDAILLISVIFSFAALLLYNLTVKKTDVNLEDDSPLS